MLWVFAVTIVNLTWSFIAESEAKYEINSITQNEEQRDVEIADFFGFEKSIPSRIEMSFHTTDQDNTQFSYDFQSESSSILYGQGLAPESVQWKGDLPPGSYVMTTETVNGVSFDQTLYTQPLLPYLVEGHIFVTICLFGIYVAEIGVRKLRDEFLKRKGVETSSSMFPSQHTNDDEQISPWRDPLVL